MSVRAFCDVTGAQLCLRNEQDQQQDQNQQRDRWYHRSGRNFDLCAAEHDPLSSSDDLVVGGTVLVDAEAPLRPARATVTAVAGDQVTVRLAAADQERTVPLAMLSWQRHYVEIYTVEDL